MRLSPNQNKLLINALVSAYANFRQLRNMIYRELNDSLDDIDTDLSRNDGAVAVHKWATSTGKLRELSNALINDRSSNPDVMAYRDSIPGDVPPPAAPLAARNFEYVLPVAAWSGKASGLEALVQEDSPLTLVGDWVDALKQAQARVCRIEFAGRVPVGTGFLVGSDLILTNCHVYRQIENSSAIARFDCYAVGPVGVDYPIQKGSLAVSTEDKLDFALLRLAKAVEPKRGKFVPKKHEFKISEVQLILQYAKGDPLQIGIGHVTAVLQMPKRVVYNTNTEPGSSGSPVFTADWELVAIHHFGDPRNNIGIPIAPIWELLASSGQI